MKSLFKLVAFLIVLSVFAPIAAHAADVINIDSRSGSSALIETYSTYSIQPTAPSPIPMPYPNSGKERSTK
jgi:hypothetical protein